MLCSWGRALWADRGQQLLCKAPSSTAQCHCASGLIKKSLRLEFLLSCFLLLGAAACEKVLCHEQSVTTSHKGRWWKFAFAYNPKCLVIDCRCFRPVCCKQKSGNCICTAFPVLPNGREGPRAKEQPRSCSLVASGGRAWGQIGHLSAGCGVLPLVAWPGEELRGVWWNHRMAQIGRDFKAHSVSVPCPTLLVLNHCPLSYHCQNK